MRADIGGGGLSIAHLPQRKAKAQLFTGSGRGVIVAMVATGALLIGLGLVASHADNSPVVLTPLAYIGR